MEIGTNLALVLTYAMVLVPISLGVLIHLWKEETNKKIGTVKTVYKEREKVKYNLLNKNPKSDKKILIIK